MNGQEGEGGTLGQTLKHFPNILKTTLSGWQLAALFVLCALVAIVTIAVTGVDASARTAVITFIAAAVVVVLVALIVHGRAPQTASEAAGETVQPVDIRYDAFISAPMDGLAEKTDFQTLCREVGNICDALQAYCGVKTTFYAGTTRKDGRWQEPFVGLKENWEALRESRYFVMIYPRYAASSIIFEAGLAVALGKPSVWFCKTGEKLPYLLRGGAGASGQSGLPRITVIEYDDLSQIIEKMQVDGCKLFE